MKRLFEIQTLSDCNRLQDHTRLGFEPVTVITGTIGFLNTIFPNIWGGRSQAQVSADEQASMQFHQAAFLRKHNIQLPQSVVIAVLRPGWDMGENGSQLWQRIIVRFYNENKEALLNAGKFPGGRSSGGVYTPFGDLGLPLIIGAGVLLFVMMKKKKR